MADTQIKPQADPTQQLRDKIQTDIVKVLTSKLEAGEMTEERAKEIAKLVLEKLPSDISYARLMEILPKLDDHFVELSTVVVPIMADYEKKIHSAVEEKVAELIKAGKFDEVLAATKEGIEQESKLS